MNKDLTQEFLISKESLEQFAHRLEVEYPDKWVNNEFQSVRCQFLQDFGNYTLGVLRMKEKMTTDDKETIAEFIEYILDTEIYSAQ
jgi:FKBP-type peptidyl-prolyl cis-trans isomerase (trigger factor)